MSTLCLIFISRADVEGFSSTAHKSMIDAQGLLSAKATLIDRGIEDETVPLNHECTAVDFVFLLNGFMRLESRANALTEHCEKSLSNVFDYHLELEYPGRTRYPSLSEYIVFIGERLADIINIDIKDIIITVEPASKGINTRGLEYDSENQVWVPA